MPDVILIGGNHHNGLGLVRSFGRKGIKPYGIIVDDKNSKSFIQKSKYWKDTIHLSENEEIIPTLMSRFVRDEKSLVIPWSDGAAYTIDKYYHTLSDHFILPSINQEGGEIIRLMDKAQQIPFAHHIGISMLPSEIISLEAEKTTVPFPVILKPVTSVEGHKSDMSICKEEEDLHRETLALKEKGFTRILVQHYLENRREYVVTGAISDQRYSFTVVSHIRQWPPHFGTGSFSETVLDSKINDFCSHTLRKIKEAGYRGTIDFEFFESEDGTLYINEINWRSSGRNFISKVTGIESAYMYYCDCFGLTFEMKEQNETHVFSMNEITDVNHILHHNISMNEWYHDLRRTQSFAVWDRSDMAPFFDRMIGKVIRRIIRRR